MRKHGVSFEDAATVFDHELAVVQPDDEHPEVRSIIVGTSRGGRLLVCVHVESEEEIRIISARRTTKRERRDHEEGK